MAENPKPVVEKPPQRQLPYSQKIVERSEGQNGLTQVPFDSDLQEEIKPKRKSKFR